MADKATLCLARIHDLAIGEPALPSVNDLVSLYCYSLELSSFEEGQQIVRYLLQRNRSALSPLMKNLPQLLGKFEDHLFDFMALVVMDDPPATLTRNQSLVPVCSPSLEIVLQRLFDTREKDGTFEIVINGCPPQRVHSFVLYSRWSYFRHMIDAGMREASQRSLKLPSVDADGGMHPEVLTLILEVAYTMKFDADKLSEDLSLSLLSIAGLYLQGYENHSSDNVFQKVIHAAKKKILNGINPASCVRIFKAASDLQLDTAAQRAADVIVANFQSLIADSGHESTLKALPTALQCQILWRVVGK
jgi:hypothetical protein